MNSHRRMLVTTLIAVCVMSLSLLAGLVASEALTDGPQVTFDGELGPDLPGQDDAAYRKLGSQLGAVASGNAADLYHLSPAAGPQDATPNIFGDPGNHAAAVLPLAIGVSGDAARVVGFLSNDNSSARGVINVFEDYVEAYVPATALAGLARLEDVAWVRPLSAPTRLFGSVTNRGVAGHRANYWHKEGITGAGVKVGVIDKPTSETSRDGFTGIRTAMGDELPSTVVGRCYTDRGQPTTDLANCDQTGGSSHGRKVAQILMDMAPGADLYVANPGTWGDLRLTVEWMKDQGVDVIVHSAIWAYDGPGDGTSPFSMSPTNTVNWAADNGIVWVNAAGNHARKVWYGAFKDDDNDGRHEWFRTYETQNYQIDSGRTMRMFMRWDDVWGGATKDLNIEIWRIDGKDEVLAASSADVQSGGSEDYPFEELKFTAPQTGKYRIVVTKASGGDPAWLQFAILGPSRLLHYSRSGSVLSPADGNHPGLLAVGATHWYDTYRIRSESSWGPAPDGRGKPDLIGVTCTRYEGLWQILCGTSAAAPQIAGLAALVKEVNPHFTPGQIAQFLRDHASRRTSTVPDNTWGWGVGRLPSFRCNDHHAANGTRSNFLVTVCNSLANRGKHARYHTFNLDQASTMTIDLEAATDVGSNIDTHLYLRSGYNSQIGTVIHEDDNSGDGTNARISATLEPGAYTIEATTAQTGITGGYKLKINGVPSGASRPTVSIGSGGDVTEGDAASFVLTVSPVPNGPLTVGVDITQQGNYVTTGSRAVTISSQGTAVFMVPTIDDTVGEADGRVTATITSNEAYVISATEGAATVAVADNDGGAPARVASEVGISSDGDVTEGTAATFTLTASPAPASALTVNVNVSQSGDFGVTTGSRTVTVGTSGTATLTVATIGDDTDEPDGSVTVTVNTDSGYTVSGSQASAKAAIADDDGTVPMQLVEQAFTPNAQLVAQVTAKADAHSNAGAAERLRKIVKGMKGEDGGYSAAECRSAADHHGVTGTWKPWCDEIDRRENWSGTTPTPTPTPEVSISAGSGVTEGGSAVFTLTANPAPASDLTVSVTVSQQGDYGVTTGPRTVTISTSGTATLTVATAGDSVDESDGSVTATLNTGSGYTVSASNGAATVTVSDDDVPEVSISAGSGVTEGGSAVFTLTASPAPHAALTVDVNVSQQGDYGATTGSRTVTIPTSGTATLTVATTGDDVDEPDGSVTAALAAGSGYTVSTSSGAATVTVSDDDDPPSSVFVPDAALAAEVEAKADAHTNAGAAERLRKIVKGMKGESGGYSAAECRSAADHHGVAGTWKPWCDEIERRENWSGTTPTPTPTPEVGISAGAGVIEGAGAVFTLTASPAPASDLVVNVDVAQSGDYGVTTGSRTVTIPTSGTATLTVATVGDSVDESDGSVTATLASGNGYTVSTSNGAATVAVSDDDVPEIGISGGAGITEGGSAVFTLTATPAPAADLTVNVTVAQSGDYGVTAGSRTVTIGASGTATLTVATTGDDVDEPDGSVTATLAAGSGYTIGSSGVATVSISDDDDAPAAVFVPDAALVAEVEAKADAHTNAGAAERLRKIVKGMKGESGGYSAAECRSAADHHGVAGTWKPWCDEIERRESWTPPAEPEVSISAGAGITEGVGAVFTLIASPAPASDLTVNVDVSQQGDYGVSTGSRTVTVGTGGTATLTVATTGDDVDEADGSVTVTLVAGSGYTVSASNGTDTVAVADDDAPAVFVPDPQLVAAVTAKADAHSNPAAAERLRKIVKGMKGEDGGYSAAQCRQVADDHGVTGTWKPWCDEIERRENWTPSLRPSSLQGGGGAAWALAARGLVWDQIAAAIQPLEARRIVDGHVCTDESEQAALYAGLDDGDRIYPELQADHDIPALWDGSTPFVVDISSTFPNAEALLDVVADEAERIRQVLGYEIVVAGEVLDLGDLEADDLSDLGTARYLIPPDQRIEIRCCYDEGDEFAGMAWPWMRMILLEDDGFQARHIVVHELYHLLGFTHPAESPGVVMSDSLMYGPGTDAFGASIPTQPSPLDLAKLACIYD